MTKISSVELSTTDGSSTGAEDVVVVVGVVIVDVDDDDDEFVVCVSVVVVDSAAAAVVVVDVVAVAPGVSDEVDFGTLIDSIASCSFWKYVRDGSLKGILRRCG